jgi:plasmid stabilization system protein ParE
VKWPRLTAAAYNDLAEATVYFAGKGRDASRAFVTDFERAMVQIQRSPRQFGRLETDASEHEIRRAVLRRFGYLILYEVRSETPEIFAVVHGSREPSAWKSRLTEP